MPASFFSISGKKSVPIAPGLQSLSLFRILLGLVLLYNYLVYQAPFFGVFFSDEGFYPRALNAKLQWGADLVSVLQWSSASWYLELFHVLYVTALVFFIIGYQTKIVKWIVFIGVDSLYYRDPMIMYGFDDLCRLFLFWCLFVPLSRYWSVDSALRRGPRDTPVPPVFLLAIELQIGMLYLFSALFKLTGRSWLAGFAPGYAMVDSVHGTALGEAFVNTFPFLIAPLNYGVIAFQLVFPILIFSPLYNRLTRTLAMLGGFAMHYAFIFLLEVGMFPFICISYLVLLVPDSWINGLLARRRARLEKITLYFDPDCGFCEKTALLFRELCLSPFTKVVAASSENGKLTLLRQHNSWIVEDAATGKIYMKWPAVAFVLRRNPFTWILGALSDLSWLKKPMTAVYDFIGRSRPALGRLTSIFLPFAEEAPPSRRLTRVLQGLCAGLIVLAFVGNVLSLPMMKETSKNLRWLRRTIIFSRLYQKWDLFAPNPVHNVLGYRALGFDASGKMVNLTPLFERGVIWHRDPIHLGFKSHYWLKYYFRLYDPRYAPVLKRALVQLCRDYDSAHPEALLKTANIQLLRSNYDYIKQGASLAPEKVESLVCPDPAQSASVL